MQENKMNDIEKVEKILEAVGNPKQEKDLFGDRWVLLPSGQFRVMDLPNDLNAIRQLELLVIEKVGECAYGEAIYDAVIDQKQLYGTVNEEIDFARIATADAQTRIAAMLAALEGK